MPQPEQQKPATRVDTGDDLVSRIRKLRWIGRDYEADTVAQSLARLRCQQPLLDLPVEPD